MDALLISAARYWTWSKQVLQCCAPEAVPLARLVAVAGPRRRVEESFQQGKGLAGR
uniref:hypothetical protein n=1 Tax=Haloactinospora alba TaxID=405555 RepID=UPI001476E5B2|nr:hypothetical protein [Haloactinospora alba]